MTGHNGNYLPPPYNLLSGATYNAAGQIKTDTLGTGETETFTYDTRLRLQAETAALSPTAIYSFSLTFAPNGDVLTANDTVNGNWNYSYDQFNRLVCSNLVSNGSCASPTNGTPTYAYIYDRFGNRWQQNGTNSMQLTFTGNSPGSPHNNNQMDGYSYDAAGNLLYDGSHHYFYNAENQLAQVDGALGTCASGSTTGTTACYYYDADGHRVHRTGVLNDTCDGTGKRDYLYDLAGHMITENNSNGTGCQDELYAGNRHLVSYGSPPAFVHTDWLGTSRLWNYAAYPTYNFQTCSNLPFGDGLNCTGGPSWPSTLHITGKERDAESGLDNFGARYDASNMGRFMSPDWSENPDPVPYAELERPSTLNLYSYIGDNPLSDVDDDGHEGEPKAAGACKSIWCRLGLLFGEGSNGQPSIRDLIFPFHFGSILEGFAKGIANQGRADMNFRHPFNPQWSMLPLDNSGEKTGALLSFAVPLLQPEVGAEEEIHHLLPQQFIRFFEAAGLDIEKFTIPLSKARHRLRPFGIHAQGPNGWNQMWAKWIAEHPNATRQAILNELARLRKAFGI